MRSKVLYIITMFLVSMIMYGLVACSQKTSQITDETTLPTRPTEEQMQSEYEESLALDKVKIKEYEFVDFGTENSTISKYEKFEAVFSISEHFDKADYFNTNIVDIYGYFVTPGGKNEKVPAFLLREDGTFALRYSPRETGDFSVFLKDEISGTESSAITFTTTDAREDSRGFISIEGNKLVDSDGYQLTVFGTNFAWGSINEFETTMPVYKENGMNFIRFWGQCPWSPFNLERSPKTENGVVILNEVQNDSVVEYEGLGIYSLTNAERFDNLVETLEENNIYMMYCWRNLWEFTSNHWETNPYNTENGGMCYWKTNDTNFWTHPLALKYQKQALRYIVARYGYSTSFAIFEYWNECDNKVTPDSHEINAEWHRTMDEYLKSIDIYNTPTTTSYAWLDHKDLNGRNPWKDLGFLDIFNGHRYSATGVDPLDKWQQQISDLNSNAGDLVKPVFMGEFSEDNAESKAGGQFQDNYFKEGIWAPIFFMNTAGTNLHWRVDNSFMPSEKMLSYMKVASDLIKPFEKELSAMTFDTYSENDFMIGAYRNENTGIFYIRDIKPEGETAFYMSLEPRVQIGSQITVKGLEGDYLLSFYSTETGNLVSSDIVSLSANGSSVALPEFNKDLFITAERNTN